MIKAVVEPKYERKNIELEEFWVAVIEDKKTTCDVIKKLNYCLPNDLFKHLKRINGKNMLVILASYKSFDEKFLKQILSSNTIEVFNISLYKLPKFPAYTRTQYELSNKIWPTHYYENKKYTNQLNFLNYYNTNLEAIMIPNMMEAIKMAHKALMDNNEPVGAVIVDP
ncbi:unnamed protein product [Gordionus sp. m RMFG-2023]|uniref:probable inactive tRNA-specific adenosine deaminase-like protein 3 isoform X1 n=1 Tax=Gordionus sp. m RMFG-2023 TaxID=3053472 RepID=UPI0030E1F1EB